MAEKLKQYLETKIEGSVVTTEPFPFLYIQDFFPEDFYQKLNSIYPSESLFTSLNDKLIKPLSIEIQGRSSVAIFSRETQYTELQNYKFRSHAIEFRKFCCDFLIPLLANKLNVSLPERYDDDTRFVLDREGYIKRPHTDHPSKVFSILVYMSHSKCGTTILKPNQEGFRDDYGYDHNFGDFQEVFDPPFQPNCLLAFERTDTSFHCVKRVTLGESRRAIHITVRS